MNLVLHQLRKELRWLWPRWVVFVVALIYDFVVQIQWVFPFGEEAGFGLMSLVWSVPMWFIAWWLLMSVPSEEHGMAFRVTRPLSRVQYWLARVLAGVVMVMLPAMMENAAVLLAQGRPWTDVARGVGETGIAVAVMMLWLLPAGTILRGWEKYAALVLFLFAAMNFTPVLLLEIWGVEHRDWWWVLSNASLMHRAAACVGVLMLLLAFWHSRRPLGRILRLVAPVVMCLLWMNLGMVPEFPNATEAPVDEALVKRMTQGREIEVRGVETAKSLENDGLPLRAEVRMDGIPTGIAPYWRVEHCRIMQDGMEVKEVPPTRFDTRDVASNVDGLPFQIPLASLLPSSFPPDTLVLMQGRLENVRLASLPLDMKPGKPLELDLHLAADWLRVRELGRMPLKAGATIRTPENEIEVMKVIANTDNRGHERKGALTLRLRERHVTFAGRNAARPFMPVLCLWAANKRLVWQQVMTGIDQQRGENHGWMTLQREVTFLWPVVSPGTGVTMENLAQQELVWIGGDYLGTSQHEVKLSNVDLGDGWRHKDQWPQTPASLTPENPRVAFLEHVKSLPRPDLKASGEEIAKFIAAVYAAEVMHEHREDLDEDLKPKWPGNDLEVAQMLAPYFLQQPDLLQGTLRKGMRGWHAFTDCVAGQVLQLAKIKGCTPSESQERHMTQYRAVRQVADQTGTFEQRMADPLPGLESREVFIKAGVEAIRSGSDEPLWRMLGNYRPRTDEEVWADFAKSISAGNLRYLAKKPAYRDQACALTKREFEHLPAACSLSQACHRVLEAAVVLGDAKALGWLLQSIALKDMEHDDALQVLASAHEAIFDLQDPKPEPKALRGFQRDCRKWSAKDFRYDAVKMRWELQTDVKP